MVVQMVAIGEETGAMDGMLAKIADFRASQGVCKRGKESAIFLFPRPFTGSFGNLPLAKNKGLFYRNYIEGKT